MWVEKNGKRFRVMDRDGKRKFTVKTFDTESEAILFAGAKRTPYGGISIPSIDKYFKVMERHTPLVVDYGTDLAENPAYREATRHKYNKALDKIEDSPLGAMEVHQVTASDIRQFGNSLKSDRDATIQFVRQLFKAAAREFGIPDPCERANLKRPKAKQKRLNPLTLAEVERLCEFALDDQERLWFRIGAYTGLRGGETGGLRVSDVDFDRCRFNVVQNATTVGSVRSIGATKTENSERNIPVPCSLTEDIAAYVKEHPPLADGLLFRTVQGGLVTAYQISRATRRAAKRAGIRNGQVSSHDLRHACAANLIKQGNPAKAIQLHLGHGSIRITMDTYGRLFEGDDAALATGMEAALQAARGGAS